MDKDKAMGNETLVSRLRKIDVNVAKLIEEYGEPEYGFYLQRVSRHGRGRSAYHCSSSWIECLEEDYRKGVDESRRLSSKAFYDPKSAGNFNRYEIRLKKRGWIQELQNMLDAENKRRIEKIQDKP